MKALTKRLAIEWQKARCDPDKRVEYLLEPLPNCVAVYLAAKHNVKPDGSAMAVHEFVIDILRFSLKGLRGLEDPRTGKDYKLEYDEPIKIAGVEYKAVKAKCLDALPPALFAEVSDQAWRLNNLSPEEVEQLGFTQSSSPQGSRAKAMKKGVRTGAKKAG